MEELFKTLNVKEINFFIIDYTDNHGNTKKLQLERYVENCIDEKPKRVLVEEDLYD